MTIYAYMGEFTSEQEYIQWLEEAEIAYYEEFEAPGIAWYGEL